MLKKILLFISFSLFLLAHDITKEIEYIGTPYNTLFTTREDAYSRNVWDLQVYDNLLFIGAGNSANEGPSTNSGPIPLMLYNPKTKKFKKETIIYDDQIDTFNIINGELMIPGHDATGSWDWGNVYKRLPDKSWKMYRTVPKALHIYDLVYFDHRLFAGIGLDEGAAVGTTTDLEHWNMIKLGSSRVYSFLPLGGKLFALKKFKRIKKPYLSVVQYVGDGLFSARYDISIYDIFPDTRFEIKYSRVTRIITLGDKAIYVGAYKYNSHQTKPFGLYVTHMHKGKLLSHRIMLKDGYVPRDIIAREKTLYVLTSRQNKIDTTIEVIALNEDNLDSYNELFSFQYPTFARSFELLDGYFYFGMGSDVDEGDNWDMNDIKQETGDILRYSFHR